MVEMLWKVIILGLVGQGVTIAKNISTHLVSYVMYAPHQSNDIVHQMCITNANIFLSRGVVNSIRVDYVFNLVGNTLPTSKISAAVRSMSNVYISRVPNEGVDLLAHLNTIKLSDKRYKYYIFLNCGARGPYFLHKSAAYPLKPSMAWISRFMYPMRNGASAVGATISIEISPHIQTYAMALNYQAAKFAISYWDRLNGTTFPGKFTNKLTMIANLEVGLSSALVKGGFDIASLDTRMQKIYSSKTVIGGDLFDNPTVCRRNSSGCEGVEPCEVIFVKYGGDVLSHGFVPKVTFDKFSLEDTNAGAKKPHMCKSMLAPYRPYWDVPSIFKNMLASANAGNWVDVDFESDLAIIVRVHSSYSQKFITLLWILESSAAALFKQVRVIAVPTDQHSILVLRDTLDEYWNTQTGNTSSAKRVRVSLMEFPSWLYEEYGTYLRSLCHSEYKTRALGLYSAYTISRFCDINSPLHYLLCDLTLHYITSYVSSCQWIITTNADNFYSPGFFDSLASTNVSEHDVMMSNMLTRGSILVSEPRLGEVDLGAYAVSTSFLKKWNASFLNSLPSRCGPRNYHDTDGHFIEYLVSKKARIKKTTSYSFIHN